MKTMKHLLISVMLVVMLASVGVFAACQPSTPGGDSSSGGEQVQEYGEQGDYYCNAEGNEYQLTLGKGILTMAMQTEMAGTYAYDGETMTVTIGGQTVSAQLQNNILTFTYGGEQLTWYKKVNYTVTFETNGGSAVAAQQVMNGKTFAKPADPTKPEYNFITWYTDEALTKAYAFGTAPVTGDMTLYARFEPAVEGQEEFMATLMAEGQEVAQMQTIGGVLYELPVAEKEGATFAGWWMSVDGDTDKLVCKYEGQTLSQHTTLVAVYSDNAVLVSVNENGAINWTAPGVNNQYVLEIYNNQNGEMVNTVSGGTTKYNYDFNKLPAGEYKVIVKVAGTDLAGTVFFENKVLDKVCLFEVKDGVLMFNAVENAQEYLITIDCGDENHNHVEISNGSSTTYNFANCQMQEDGIIFIVKAVAENFIASSSVPYAFEQSLAAVEGLTVTQEGMLVWNAVENATAYVVEINGKAVNVGNVTEYSIANLAAGQVSIKVQAVAKAYNAGAAAELGYEKEAMAAPANVAVNGNALTWDAVAGAVSYNVMVGDKVYNVTGTTFAITAEHFAEGQELQVKVQAVAENQAQNSYYGAAVNVSNVQTVQQVNYQSGVATWNYVMGATAYLVKVNDGEEMTVTTNSAAVVLTKEGVNVISVCGMKDGAQLGEWAAANVTAYSVTFNTLGGSEVATQYYAVGDKINLPESTLDGYTIGG
ncbi:MAG: InlB B-repeat-containing protein, partial [Clostridia bacterium]|nr:InlB B-repeat-containing protein [Clostridia bacterium]